MIIFEQFIVRRYFFFCKILKQGLFGTDDIVGKRNVDERVFGTIVSVKTAPAIFGWRTADVSVNGVVMNVKQYGQEGAACLDRHTVEAVLKEMAASGIFIVVPSDKYGPEALEKACQTIGGRPDQKVHMIIHQAIRIYLTIIFLYTI